MTSEWMARNFARNQKIILEVRCYKCPFRVGPHVKFSSQSKERQNDGMGKVSESAAIHFLSGCGRKIVKFSIGPSESEGFALLQPLHTTTLSKRQDKTQLGQFPWGQE